MNYMSITDNGNSNSNNNTDLPPNVSSPCTTSCNIANIYDNTRSQYVDNRP